MAFLPLSKPSEAFWRLNTIMFGFWLKSGSACFQLPAESQGSCAWPTWPTEGLLEAKYSHFWFLDKKTHWLCAIVKQVALS